MISDAPPGDAPGAPLAPGRRRWQRVLVGLVVATLGLFLARRPILNAVPPLLVTSEPEETADAIVVLAGDSGARVVRAVELWKKGRSSAGVFAVSGGPIYHATTWAALMAAHAEELGVPRASIVLQDRSRTTVEDARYTLELLEKRGVKSIVLVTSAWHSRRAKRCFETAAEGRVRVVSCPAPPPSLEGDWWQDAEATRAIVTEILKYAW